MYGGMAGLAGDILARICADTRAETARRSAICGLDAIRRKAGKARPRGFGRRLMDAGCRAGMALIAEIKRASPSGGTIRPDLDVAEMARMYERAGAACLSVLTDGPHFGGSGEDLRAAREATELPALRKDFILDVWQVYESAAMGADAILLILAALTDAEARDLEQAARDANLDVLAEVHDAAELGRALGLQTKLIGINNRDLKTLRTDVETSLRLASLVPADRFLVSESGIRTAAELAALRAVGVHGVLVGESLLRQDDPEAATRALLGQ